MMCIRSLQYPLVSKRLQVNLLALLSPLIGLFRVNPEITRLDALIFWFRSSSSDETQEARTFYCLSVIQTK